MQDPAEFACQTINRDVWSHPTVKAIVRANFVFWQVLRRCLRHFQAQTSQVYINTADGARIKGYYKVSQYPYVAILDARSGEEIRRLSIVDAAGFTDACKCL